MRSSTLILATMLASVCATSAWSQTVTSQLSSQEAFVDSRVLYKVRIANANKFDAPKIPEIDGLRVESAGAPSRSSFLKIENGRRTSSVTMTYTYWFYPQREGSFEIPAISLEVDGQTLSTSSHTLSATKSETGDLLFVEATSDAEQAYVGQPVELRLKVWIRPFTDRELRIRLSEANMWSLISNQTSWGPFAERLTELAGKNRRPAGSEVLRKDTEGVSRLYYVYEVESTVYPKRAGAISSDAVRVVVDYPGKLVRKRSRGGFFGPSMIEQMMGRSQLSLEASRPISATGELSGVKIRDIPTLGKPKSYRGAVGEYELQVQASPLSVRVGEPISVRLIVQGDGPMELIEAPPLANDKKMARQFKIEDKNLAGFVKNDLKVFATTIRPKSESVQEIPPIEFSYFDPKTESFATSLSRAIPITVTPNESLSLDSIVAAKKPQKTPKSESWWFKNRDSQPNTDLSTVREMTAPLAKPTKGPLYWPFFVAPVAAVLGVLWFYRNRTSDWLALSRNPDKNLRQQIQNADVPTEIRDAMDRASEQGLIPEDKAKRIREECDRLTFSQDTKETARAGLQRVRQLAMEALPFVLAFIAIFGTPRRSRCDVPELSLAPIQATAILEQARIAHAEARELPDSADAQESLEIAIEKYELVVESGLQSTGLYLNLGDAYMQAAQWGHALGALEIARSLSPTDGRIRERILRIEDQLGFSPPQSKPWMIVYDLLPQSFFWWLSLISWSVFWVLAMLLLVRRGWRRPPVYWMAATIGVLAIACIVLSQGYQRGYNAIATGDSPELRAADGKEFAVIDILKDGEAVSVLDKRGKWARVRALETERTGWIPLEQLYLLNRA